MSLFFIDEKEIENSFAKTADILLLKKALVINNINYRFTEIEFYYYGDQHFDGYTHRHDMEAGKWRFHNQGFDITLRGKTGYGGILIRGIRQVHHTENPIYINGPRRVLFEISRHFNPVETVTNEFGIVNAEELSFEPLATFRQGLKNPVQQFEGANKYVAANYRYLVDHHRFDRKQFSGLEEIARRFNDAEKAYKFLNYHLKV